MPSATIAPTIIMLGKWSDAPNKKPKTGRVIRRQHAINMRSLLRVEEDISAHLCCCIGTRETPSAYIASTWFSLWGRLLPASSPVHSGCIADERSSENSLWAPSQSNQIQRLKREVSFPTSIKFRSRRCR
jgi:hypothetical protein